MSCRSRGSGSKTSPSRLDARDLAHLLAAGAAQPGQYAPARMSGVMKLGGARGTASCSDHQIGVGSPLARRQVSLRSTGPGCTHPHWRHRDPTPRLPLPELPTGSMTETRRRPRAEPLGPENPQQPQGARPKSCPPPGPGRAVPSAREPATRLDRHQTRSQSSAKAIAHSGPPGSMTLAKRWSHAMGGRHTFFHSSA